MDGDRKKPNSDSEKELSKTYADRTQSEQAEEEVASFDLARGTNVGRYLIVDELGRGGMGEVYRAFDPDLNRPVALKILNGQRALRGDDSLGRQRLLREAQALAQLSHPNVVAVHDVGTFEKSVFIAMELVEGLTLKQWLRQTHPDWRQIVAVMQAAGQGLAAAHLAGMVHRDFKPSNMIIGKDGRVRVLDFGLARAEELMPTDGIAAPLDPSSDDGSADLDDSLSTPSLESSSDSLLRSSLTQVGSIVGTIGYMAPEQLQGKPCRAASDQFAFCVVLFQALQGKRPFGGRLAIQRYGNILRGKIRKLANADVPSWVMRIAEKGLAADPADRYPSMTVLLAELANDPTEAMVRKRAQLRHRLWVGALLSIFAAIAVFGLWYGVTRGARLCAGADAHLQAIWNPERKEAIQKRFKQSKRHYALDTFDRVVKILDKYATAWNAGWTEACRATHLGGEQSESMLDLRMQCLQRRLNQLDALCRVLSEESGEDVVDRAVKASLELDRLDACADREALAAQTPPPRDPKIRPLVKKLYARLDRVKVLEDSGQYETALQMSQQLSSAAKETAYQPLLAEVLFRLASVEERAGTFKKSIATLERAADIAARNRMARLTARIHAEAMFTRGVKLAQGEQARAHQLAAETSLALAGGDDELAVTLFNFKALLLEDHGHYDQAETNFNKALALHRKLSGPDTAKEAALLNNYANLLQQVGRAAEARGMHEQSLRIKEKVLGAEHPDLAFSLKNLGSVYIDLGQLDKAQHCIERALVIQTRAVGPAHSLVASSLRTLGRIHVRQGQFEEARKNLQRALAIYQDTLGADHPRVASVLNSLGALYWEQGKLDLALSLLERALAIRNKALSAKDTRIAYSLSNLGLVLTELGRHLEAMNAFQRALAIREKAFGPDHQQVAYSLSDLGELSFRQGKLEEARSLHSRSASIAEKTLGVDSSYSVWPVTRLGETAAQSKRLETARDYFKQALAVCTAKPHYWLICARARFGLAQVLRKLGQDPAHARQLAEEALKIYSEILVFRTREAQDIKTWLRK